MTGNLYVVSAPSGAGKTSLVRALVGSSDDIQVAVSHTTRDIRPGEEQGKAYHFISHEQFSAMITNNEFLEYAEVFGHYYGTSHHSVKTVRDQGQHLVLEIDWQGAQQIRAEMPEATLIFILPPSLEILRERLVKRGRDNASNISERMAEAITDASHCRDFDHVVINDNFEAALSELKEIVRNPAATTTLGAERSEVLSLIADFSAQ